MRSPVTIAGLPGSEMVVMFQSWPPPATSSPSVSSCLTAEDARQAQPAVRRAVLCLQPGGVTGTVSTTAGTSPSHQHSPAVWVSLTPPVWGRPGLLYFTSHREMLFPLRGEEAAGAHLFLRKVESGHNTKQSETGVQNEVGGDFIKNIS